MELKQVKIMSPAFLLITALDFFKILETAKRTAPNALFSLHKQCTMLHLVCSVDTRMKAGNGIEL
jgi:hypothetical protein